MKYIFTIIVFILISNTADAQRLLFNQRYDSMAEDFNIKEKKLNEYKSEGKVIVFNEEKHKTKLAKKMLKSRKGKSKTIDKGLYELEYEIIGKEKITHHRVRYIYIDKDRFKSEESLKNYINKVRQLLDVNVFKSVAMQYSMDYSKNVGGDSGWFKKGKTHPEFFKHTTSTNRLADEIFEFEIPEYNAYYFAKKSFSKKEFEEVLVLQTKIDK